MRPSKTVSFITALTLLSSFSGALSPAHSSEGNSSEGNSKRVTRLAAPNGVVTVPASTSTVLRFTAVPNATSYKVRVYAAKGENPLRTIAPFNSGDSVSALTPNSTYKITVQAIANGVRYSNSEESRKVSVTTLTVTTGTCANGGTCIVGDRGPGGGIVYYVAATNFTSTGSTCNTACKYLEVAPATWQSAGVTIADDLIYKWSTNTTVSTGQDLTTTSTEGIAAMSTYEKLNWKIGQGFYNTSVMKVSGETSTAQAVVLAYAGTDLSSGQWFIPSMNEINELCKYARGQTTGDPTLACVTGSGTFKNTGNAGTDLGGFVESYYWSSTEFDSANAWLQIFFSGGQNLIDKTNTTYVRPVRAF